MRIVQKQANKSNVVSEQCCSSHSLSMTSFQFRERLQEKQWTLKGTWNLCPTPSINFYAKEMENQPIGNSVVPGQRSTTCFVCHKRIFHSNRIEVPRQSPNSPDLNSCDRWMNEFIKKQLKATNVHEIGDLFVAVRKILSSVAKSIFKEELQKYFSHCDHVI